MLFPFIYNYNALSFSSLCRHTLLWSPCRISFNHDSSEDIILPKTTWSSLSMEIDRQIPLQRKRWTIQTCPTDTVVDYGCCRHVLLLMLRLHLRWNTLSSILCKIISKSTSIYIFPIIWSLFEGQKEKRHELHLISIAFYGMFSQYDFLKWYWTSLLHVTNGAKFAGRSKGFVGKKYKSFQILVEVQHWVKW